MIYAIIAAGLIFWLRSILGTRNDSDAERPAPEMKIDIEGKIINLGEAKEDTKDILDSIKQLIDNPKGNMSISGQSAELGLVDIAKIDKAFDVSVFLQAAQDAFAYVVESFAEGDRETLEGLLGDDVFKAFDKAISIREKSGDIMETEIRSINKSEITEAGLNGNEAVVTIRFWADETSVTKDSDGKIISGDPDKTTLMRDVWTFSRNLKSSDPRWLVIETREDGEDDNDTIPNTH